jgi:hypothetical protein
MERKKDLSDILTHYGVYNQSGVNAYRLDVELNDFMNEKLLKILKGLKRIYMDRDKMGKKLDKMIEDCKESIENYG